MGCDPLHDLMSKGYRSYNFYRLYDFCSIPPRELAEISNWTSRYLATVVRECVNLQILRRSRTIR